MEHTKALLLSNKRVKSNYWNCRFLSAEIAAKAHAGQFVNVRVSSSDEPLLRRPFSIHRASGRHIEILYEVIGKGSEILSQQRAGEYLDIIGPLGNGFAIRHTPSAKRQAIIIAGGMGVAPLLFLAENIVHSPQTTVHKRPIVLIGAKTKSHILCEKEFKKLGCDVKIATDDGSKGFKGKATDLLESVLRTTHNAQRTTLYACGPRPMLKEISRTSEQKDIPAQISLEEHMACGIGACLGCAVDTIDGYKRVCKEGPVFNAGEIVWV